MSEKLPRHPGYPLVDRWRKELDDQIDVHCDEDASVRKRSLRPGLDCSPVKMELAAYLTAASALVRARETYRKLVPAWCWALDAFHQAFARFTTALAALAEVRIGQGAHRDNPLSGAGPSTLAEYQHDPPLEQVASAQALVARLSPGANPALLSALEVLAQAAEALRVTRVAEITTRDPAAAAIAARETALHERNLGHAETVAASRKPGVNLYYPLFDPTRVETVASILLFPFLWLAKYLLPKRRATRHMVLASLSAALLGGAGVEGYRLGKSAGCGKACAAPAVAVAVANATPPPASPAATATPAVPAVPAVAAATPAAPSGLVSAIFGQVRNYDAREWNVAVACPERQEHWTLKAAGVQGDDNSARLGYGDKGQFNCPVSAEGATGSCVLHGGDRCSIRNGVIAAEPY